MQTADTPIKPYEFGRPSKYTHELLARARQYLGEYESNDEVIPSRAGLAVYLGISRETLLVWANDEQKKDFSAIVSQIDAAQEIRLLNQGLKGGFNSRITALVLSKHGYYDKPDGNTAGISITIARGTAKIERGAETVTVSADEETVIEHDDQT